VEEAIAVIIKTATAAGLAVGMHTPGGESAKRRLEQGFTFATVSCDVTHLEAVAAEHLRVARNT
jgi:4-hydroxy-2-oxoheptanedioate aldolase